jgi:hypothetical protein
MTNVKLLTSVMMTVLITAGCASAPSVPVEESKPEVFLPTTTLSDDLGLQPGPLTDDTAVLTESFEKYEVYENASNDLWCDNCDYSLKWDDGGRDISRVGVLSNEAQASNRQRDQVSLVFEPFEVKVKMDGVVEFSAYISLISQGEEVVAFCNGILVEVLEEAFKFPGSKYEDCTDQLYDKFDFDLTVFLFGDNSFDDGYENLRTYRMFRLMSENTFTVKIVDTNGKEHVFVFDIQRDYPSPQGYFRIAFEAEKAVKLGLGY